MRLPTTAALLVLLVCFSFHSNRGAAVRASVLEDAPPADGLPDGLIPRHDLFAPAALGAVKIHPAGARYAFIERAGGNPRLLIANVEGETPPTEIKLPGAASPVNLFWSTDGDFLIVQAATRVSGTQFFSHRLANGEAVALTPADRDAQPALERRSATYPGEVIVATRASISPRARRSKYSTRKVCV